MKKKILSSLVVFWLAAAGGLAFAQAPLPRPEHPRPQFQRADWINLNGPWTFAFDFGRSGRERGLQDSKGFEQTIVVPFCPESRLSGVAYTDFIPALWYHRALEVPAAWSGKRILLHFGAVDYESEVFIDGRSLGVHYGGTSSFTRDISRFVRPGGSHHLVLAAADDTRSGLQPSGKQCPAYRSRGCYYTRTTGIWQTVWMEATDPCGIESCAIVPDLDNGRFLFQPSFWAVRRGLFFRVTVRAGAETAGQGKIAAGDRLSLAVPLKRIRSWSPEDPFLYDISLEVLDEKGRTLDRVKSYAGLRKIHIEGDRLFLNNRPIFLRFVLDQGFYADGIWTAPGDAALKRDIELSQQAGFNGARLHQKVFEERFHYWADRLGYLTWGEASSWGCDVNKPEAGRNFLSEWAEIVWRDRNHPSLIAWTPFNETWERGDGDGRQHDRLLADIYDLTRRLDGTRPVHDTSGNYHVKTDLWTVHLYEQDPEKFRRTLTPDPEKGVYRAKPEWEADYTGQPYLVSEYGGIKWITGRAFAENSWGYGEGPKTEEEFYQRLSALTGILLDLGHVRGYCYTQLTDIEQEQNGIYNYDRSPKFDMKRIRAIFGKTPPHCK
jgi:beta-galactosidase/beta-glucuronidase